MLGTWSASACHEDPCAGDVLACEEGEAFEFVDHCEAPQALAVTLLETDGLQPLRDGGWPVLHYGRQGGVHFDLTLDLQGLDPDHEQVQVHFEVFTCTDEGCAQPTMLTDRTLYAQEEQLEPTESAVRLPGVVLVLDDAPAGAGALRVTVVDACGREITLVHSASS